MNNLYKKLSIILIFFINVCLCQWQSDSLQFNLNENDSIVFYTFPKQLHFYARDIENNDCTIDIIGEKFGSSNDILIEIYRDSELFFDDIISNSNFSLSINIDAGLYLYDLIIYSDNGSNQWQQLHEAENIVCGDAYLIQGQSNAAAGAEWYPQFDSNELVNPFIRSYGKPIWHYPNQLNNTDFAIAVADSIGTLGFVGVWGLGLASQIIELHGLPVFILNGAVGWSSVNDQTPDIGNHLNPSTIYGNLLNRAHSANLKEKIRAIFWYQGEYDHDMAFESYLDKMNIIYDGWMYDFPNIEGIYNIQTRKCCYWNVETFAMQREVNRQLPNLFPMVKGNMSSTAIEPYYWHFNMDGYLQLSDNIGRLIHRDLYGHVYDFNIEAPNPEKISWIDADTLAIDFGKGGEGLVFEEDAVEYLKLSDPNLNYELGGYSTLITFATDCNAEVEWVSFVEDYNRNGPWLINNLGLGSFAFYEVPVYPSRPYFVSQDGSDDQSCGSSSNPFQTIQKAIDVADDADTIFVSPGIYSEQIDFLGKNIVVKGENKETTIIDRSGDLILINLSAINDTTASLQGFTIKNGISDSGGGIYCNNTKIKLSDLIIEKNLSNGPGGGIFIGDTSLVKIENVHIDSNITNGEGGGIYVSNNSTVDVINSTIKSNSAGVGSGIYISNNSTVNIINSILISNTSSTNGGGIFIGDTSLVTLENVHIDSNITNGEGGGIKILNNSIVDINNSTIESNIADIEGGGIKISNNSIVDINNSTIESNIADIEGGGIKISNNSTVDIINSTIKSNIANMDGGGIKVLNNSTIDIISSIIESNIAHTDGAGLMILENSVVSIMDSHIISNNAKDHGGAIYINSSNDETSLNIVNSFIQNNQTFGWNGFQESGIAGGGLYIVNSSSENTTITITKTIISGNYSFRGSGLFAESGIIKLNSNVFFENYTTSQFNSGIIELINNPNIELFNITSANNTIDDGSFIKCGSTSNAEVGTIVSIKNSILWDQFPHQVFYDDDESNPGQITIRRTNVNGGISSIFTNDNILLDWEEKNMNEDPLFIDITNNDLKLSDDSPCLGIGLENPLSYDVINQPRPLPVGSKPDLGAYENIYGLYGDVTMSGGISSLDAALVLQHVVGIDTLDEVLLFYGDVSQNGELTSLDASYILQYVVGLIDQLPYNPSEDIATTGDFNMDNIGAMSGMTIEIPIKVSNDENIHSFQGILNYSPEALSLDTILPGNYFNSSMLFSNELIQGKVYIGGSGIMPSDGSDQIAIAVFSILENFNQYTRVSITDLKLNDNDPIAMATDMTIHHVLGIDGQLPLTFELHQNYPNPFNPITTLRYDLPEESFVNIKIYDITGRIVKNLVRENKTAGYHYTRWNGNNNLGESVSAGMYIYIIQAGQFHSMKKMILLK